MYYGGHYILLIIGAIITMIAQAKVKGAFNKYSKIRSYKGMTGAQVARHILVENGLEDVGVSQVKGNLTDHYNPSTRIVNLSEVVYDSTSIAAIAVASHECGHAIQHKENYSPMKFRSSLVPLANIGSKMGIPIIMLGWALGLEFPLANGGYFSLATIGIWVFSLSILFQVVTLPVEFDASARALKILKNDEILVDDEMGAAYKMLKAAALTYVAAAASAVLQLLRLVLINGDRKGRR